MTTRRLADIAFYTFALLFIALLFLNFLGVVYEVGGEREYRIFKRLLRAVWQGQ